MPQISSHAGSGHCARARANRVFGPDEKRIRTKNTVMQLPLNNCHIRANVLVILVAASSSAKVNTKHGVGVLYKIVVCARMRFSSVRKRRSARTVFRPRRFCQNLRAARANRVFGTEKNAPYQKHGYAITPQRLPHPRECFGHFGCGQRPRYG